MKKIDEGVRHAFESEFFSRFAPAIEKMLVYPDGLSTAEKRNLESIDELLQFFDHLAASKMAGDFVASDQQRAALGRWAANIIQRESHIILRCYLPNKFLHLAKKLGFKRLPVQMAVYGTLMRGEQHSIDSRALSSIKRIGECEIPGILYDVGQKQRYPGLVLSAESVVIGELLEIASTVAGAVTSLRKLDEYEGYDPTSPDQSEFLRRYIMLKKPRTGVWIYVLNRDPLQHGFAKIQSGNWKSFRESGNKY